MNPFELGETIVVPDERHGLELDEFLCLFYLGLSKGFVRRQIRAGRVLLDGVPVQPSQRLRGGQVLLVDLDDEQPDAPVAPEFELDVLYEDADVLAVDKPAGIAVEPERWARDKPCLSGALLALSAARGESGEAEARLRIVHRIDKDTSGVVLAAKHIDAERALRIAFQEGRVAKHYLALVEGEHPLADGDEAEIDAPIGPDPRKSGRMVVSAEGKPSCTRVSVRERFRGYTLLACRPETGRTHQIRVHLAHAGFPLAVDPLYGRRDELFLSAIKPGYRQKRGRAERPLIARLTLHAEMLEVPDPADTTRVRARVASPLAVDLERVLKQLRKVRPYSR